ncbi:MAG: flippase-like domain-containing protein [Pirellulales bacterium]|nr:flippase-like domain-containing protein [Pirellulales bacterium]
MKRRSIRRLVQLLVAVALLTVVVEAADWHAVASTIGKLRLAPLGLALALFLPQTLISALRWRAWCRPVGSISLVESIRQTLATSALNLAVPSKAGELAKAAMLPGLDAGGRARAALLAAIEKLADVVVLAAIAALLWGGAGTWIYVAGAATLAAASLAMWSRTRAALSPRQLVTLGGFTFLLWCLHLAQIGLFIRAAGVELPWTTVGARVPLAIFAGLLPVTWCGVGTRDAALVWLFADLAPADAMTVVGLLTALRYLVPGAAGIPFVGRYLPVHNTAASSRHSLPGSTDAQARRLAKPHNQGRCKHEASTAGKADFA